MKRTLTLEAENEGTSRMLLLQLAIALREFQIIPEAFVWRCGLDERRARVEVVLSPDCEHLLPKLAERLGEIDGVRGVALSSPAAATKKSEAGDFDASPLVRPFID